MPVVKRIVCLANSRKLNGRCIAGREIEGAEPRGWIRPVSAREHQEVSERERHYENGSDPAVLDIIDVPLLRSVPETFQQENWLLDPDNYWIRVGATSYPKLERLLDPVEPLWVDGYSTFNGTNDQIPEGVAATLTSSLRLIHVAGLRLKVFAPSAAFGDTKRRVQAQFEHAGSRYALWVTDPIYERRFLAQDNGSYALGECYLTVSLGEPFNGSTYKLVATIIEQPPS